MGLFLVGLHGLESCFFHSGRTAGTSVPQNRTEDEHTGKERYYRGLNK